MWFFNFLETNKILKNSFPEQTYKNIITQLGYLSLLQSVSKSELTKSRFSWRDYFADLVNYLRENSKWYSFILAAFERMSQYDIQNIKTNIKIKTLQDWPQFKQFIFDDLRMKADTLITNKMNLNAHERKSLADILNTTLSPMSSQYLYQGLHYLYYDQGKCELRIEGYFVRTSDIKIDRTVSAITIFAQYTVFIDSSFNKEGQEVFMTIIAPKWEVIGQKTINLNGKSQPKIQHNIKGHGAAGVPGGPGRTFFGIGNEFVNGNFLKVSTNGGTGGDGVNGEKGKDGGGDIDADIVKNYICKTKKKFFTGIEYIVLNNIEYKIFGKSITWKVFPPFESDFSFNADITIKSVSKSKSGFSGGKQGLGGVHSQSTKIISLHKPSQIALANNIGMHGHCGKGGKGGKGEIMHGLILILKINSYCEVLKKEQGKVQPNAADGCDNCSGVQLQPKKNLQATYSVVSKYRTFLLKQTTKESKVNIKSPQSFLNGLNSNEKIKNLA
jgi:hypothetical protein